MSLLSDRPCIDCICFALSDWFDEDFFEMKISSRLYLLIPFCLWILDP